MTDQWDLLSFIKKRGRIIFLVAIVSLSLLARISGLDFESGDFTHYLSPWYNEIDSLGKASLGTQVGNYGIPYQILILILTYLPISPLLGYKAISIVFDYLLAIVCCRITKQLSESSVLSYFCFGLVLFLPPIVLNSSVWGQCDSIYVFFCLAALSCLLAHRSKLAYLLLGIALAFKLQAVFIVPFFLLHFILSGEYPATRFLYTLAGFYIPSLPGIVARKSLLAPFSIYYGQATIDPSVAIDFPSFWCQFFNIESSSVFIYSLVLTIAVFVFAAAAIVLTYKRGEIQPIDNLLFATLSVWTCVEFLPSMHERYGYMLFALLTICVVVARKCDGGGCFLLAMWVVNLVTTIIAYSAYLYRTPELAQWFQTAVFISSVFMFVCWLVFALRVTRFGKLCDFERRDDGCTDG